MKTALLVTALFLSGVSTVHAGGWVVVVLDNMLEGVVAGEEQIIGFTILAHGRSPASGYDANIDFTHRETGATGSVRAQDEGTRGHYAAQFVLAKAGWWDWKVRVFNQDFLMPPIYVGLTVAKEPAPLTTAKPGDLVYYGPTPLPAEPSELWPVAVAAGLSAVSVMILRKRDGVTMGISSNSRRARRARSLVTT